MADGFLWGDSTYRSSTTIARAITGTAWNGPRFFGVRPNLNGMPDVDSVTSLRTADAPRSAGPATSTVGRLLHRLDLSRPPSFVEPRFKRTVETQKRIPALAGGGLHPVVFLAGRSLRSEIDIH